MEIKQELRGQRQSGAGLGSKENFDVCVHGVQCYGDTHNMQTACRYSVGLSVGNPSATRP